MSCLGFTLTFLGTHLWLSGWRGLLALGEGGVGKRGVQGWRSALHSARGSSLSLHTCGLVQLQVSVLPNEMEEPEQCPSPGLFLYLRMG